MEPPDADAVRRMIDAARQGSLEELRGLVQQERRLLTAAGGNGNTPLMWAANEGHLPVVQYLLDEGVDIDQENADGVSALYLACYAGHLPVVALLLDWGVDRTVITSHGHSALTAAARNLRVVELLLAHRCGDIDHQIDNGMSALHLACLQGAVDVVRVLLEAGADPTLKEEDGQTPRDVAAEWGYHDIVQLLEVSLFRKPRV